ncbi:Ras family GTPase [Legionella quinlivanii]|uniref:Ras family GTPase n=1 Tax=Legionella quinlivanii TaxID=45073 RepID=A0A0W0Y4N8_9GAMM|nr:GTPase domain-containing protein [Legionella quinlivanii]KTD51618.1 Ras family GTPase [Legionella quinlivanii]SEF60895.1 small GTP-binding protein domain-containing protein [Legionella quinlivanii DSM 21216]STY10855.1 small GTP-binding protein domain [Legionella quinlivanii]
MTSVKALGEEIEALKKYIRPERLGWKNEIERIELLETYEELSALIDRATKSDKELTAEECQPFIDFLANRWKRIQQTDLAYTFNPHSPINQICWLLAERLSPVVNKEAVKLLMFNIDLSDQMSGQDLFDLKPWQFVLSDDVNNPRIIMVADCLSFAKEDGVFKHTTLEEGQSKVLTETERERVIKHSPAATAFHEAAQELRDYIKRDQSMHGYITRFIEKLRHGGAHGRAQGGRGGQEHNAGADANEGILEFAEFLDKLTKDEQSRLFAMTVPQYRDTVGTIWNRMKNPGVRANGEVQGTEFCVEVNAAELSTINREKEQELKEWIPGFVRKIQEGALDNQKTELEKKLKEKEDGFTKLMEEKISYQPDITTGIAGNARLFAQLEGNPKSRAETISALLGKYPSLGITLRIADKPANESRLLPATAVPEFHQTVDSLCPPLNSIQDAKALRIALWQLTDADKMVYLQQLGDTKLAELVPNTAALINLVSGVDEDTYHLSGRSKIAIVNNFLAKPYFKETITSYASLIPLIRNINVDRRERDTIKIGPVLESCKDADLGALEALWPLIDKSKLGAFLDNLGKAFLKKMIAKTPEQVINGFEDKLDNLPQRMADQMRSLIENQKVMARLELLSSESSSWGTSRGAIKALIDLAKGDISHLPNNMEASFDNELKEIYNQILKNNQNIITVGRINRSQITNTDEHLPVIIIGPRNSGKTSLMQRYLNDSYSDVPVQDQYFRFAQAYQNEAGVRALATFMDMGDSETRRFRNNRWGAYAKTFIITVNLTDPGSLQEAKNEYEHLRRTFNSAIPVIFAGTKSDMPNANSTLITEFAVEKGCTFIATSARDNHGVEELFAKAAELGIQHSLALNPNRQAPQPVAAAAPARTGIMASFGRFFTRGGGNPSSAQHDAPSNLPGPRGGGRGGSGS